MTFTKAVDGEVRSVLPVMVGSLMSRLEAVIGLDTVIDSFSPNPRNVLLLHGFLMKHYSMAGLGYHLRENGFRSFLRSYRYGDDLREIVKRRSKTLTDFCEDKNEKVGLVGHSEGGYVACMKAKKNPHLINTVVSLGTPTDGTLAAYLAYFFPSCRQMVPGNEFLKKFWEEDFPEDVQFHFVSTPYDEVIWLPPGHSTKRREAPNIHYHVVEDVGHLGLIGPRCYDLVTDLLKGKIN